MLKRNGFGISAQTGAKVVIIIVLLITTFVIATRRDIAYSLVIIWALVGIGINQSSNQAVFFLT